MGLLDTLESAVGGGNLARLAEGQGNFSPGSDDHQHVENMVKQAPPSLLQEIFQKAAGQMDPQIAAHVTPGVGGTNPLGGLGQGALSTIASLFMGHLMQGGGYSAGSLLSRIPGLRTTDPQQMDAGQVAAVASYTQQNHPDLFGRAAAALGQQQPGLLSHLLGGQGFSSAAQMLAGRLMNRNVS